MLWLRSHVFELAMRDCRTIIRRSLRQDASGQPATSDELDGFVLNHWIRSNPCHKLEFGEVRLSECEPADRRKRVKQLEHLKRYEAGPRFVGRSHPLGNLWGGKCREFCGLFAYDFRV